MTVQSGFLRSRCCCFCAGVFGCFQYRLPVVTDTGGDYAATVGLVGGGGWLPGESWWEIEGSVAYALKLQQSHFSYFPRITLIQ